VSFASLDSWIDRGALPDSVLRFGIRRLIGGRLRAERRRAASDPEAGTEAWIGRLSSGPISLEPDAANAQHYEVPARFFELVLGPRMKYSCALWPPGVDSLAGAEEAMLARTAERAGIADGQRVLDLGCGWGSLALWIAERYPGCEVVAVSNSRSQGEWIRTAAARRGLGNVEHRVADVGRLALDESFDRVVSVEMFEHLRNYDELLARIAGWLRPDGRLFVHVFCHSGLTYAFEDRGASDWMTRHFFRHGLMPAAGLLPRFDRDLEVEASWIVPGAHYQKTSEAWLRNLDRRREEAVALFEAAHGAGAGRAWVERWRVFFLACAELFGTSGGSEWQVAQYRFAPRSPG
jgi:cyclopropane-fatty-acyl-phospholipid synthase